ncbi:MAG TPA: carotenoid oxygenase family protein [Polyangiaceae bacterium]|jgi:carotenoid cleavage dioxygenase
MDPVQDRDSKPQPPPFHLTGAYAPLREEHTLLDLEVVGEIPPELCGTYLRNGPNPKSGVSPAWFAAEGMLHGVRLEGGRALWYRNRGMSGGALPNTNVVRHAGRILALVETRLPVEVGPELETVGTYDFGGEMKRPVSAHPKTCPTTGELVFLSNDREPPYLTIYRADARGRVVHATPISLSAPTYMHDVALTETSVIFWELPILVGDWRSPNPLRWLEGRPTRIGVLPRDGQERDLTWFEVPPCSISHTMNAFDDGDRIVVDVNRGPGIWTAHSLVRFVLDRRTGLAREEVLEPRFVDFPRVHPSVVGKRYRFGYALEVSDWESGGFQKSVPRKYDLETGQCRVHDFGSHTLSGECVVAPRPGATSEDDAWALLFVYDRLRDASDLVILDAKRFDEPPVATVRLPHRVPVGIHGEWLPDAGTP